MISDTLMLVVTAVAIMRRTSAGISAINKRNWYRAFGIILCLGGALFALDTIGFSHYHH